MRQKKMSEVATSVKHSSLSPEAPGNMQAVSWLVVTAQMGLLSCPCLSHSVDMLLSAGYTALGKHTLVRWLDKQQSRWDGTTLPTPAVSLKYGNVFWRSIQSTGPQTDFVLWYSAKQAASSESLYMNLSWVSSILKRQWKREAASDSDKE